jgi:hypothetical protein
MSSMPCVEPDSLMPVILMSGHVTTMPEGFFALLRKPSDLRKVQEVVATAVRHGRTDQA